MGWKRTKVVITELSPEPSLIRWAVCGVFMAIAGIALFMFHTSGIVKVVSKFNIWWVSLSPFGTWLLFCCLRGWFWGKEVDKHEFMKKEIEFAQKKWEAWAGRYLAIPASCIFLPDKITVAYLHDNFPQQYGLIRKINYLPDTISPAYSAVEVLLKGINDALRQLPSNLRLKVTLLTDLPRDGLTESFSAAWISLFPQRAVPEDIAITRAFSMSLVEERLKQSVLTVDLLLVMQLRGGETYSDGLAALLLTSDDVAQKYRLPHAARLLRPMPLNMDTFDEDFTLFLDTQTVACRTTCVLGDSRNWEEVAAQLMTIGRAHDAAWEPAERNMLERWCGIPGPAAAWLLTALAADLVALHNNTSLLTLFSSGEERFISTVTAGNEDEHIG